MPSIVTAGSHGPILRRDGGGSLGLELHPEVFAVTRDGRSPRMDVGVLSPQRQDRREQPDDRRRERNSDEGDDCGGADEYFGLGLHSISPFRGATAAPGLALGGHSTGNDGRLHHPCGVWKRAAWGVPLLAHADLC